jgi:hypothetical protein
MAHHIDFSEKRADVEVVSSLIIFILIIKRDIQIGQLLTDQRFARMKLSKRFSNSLPSLFVELEICIR